MHINQIVWTKFGQYSHRVFCFKNKITLDGCCKAAEVKFWLQLCSAILLGRLQTNFTSICGGGTANDGSKSKTTYFLAGIYCNYQIW